ncbi:MAG: elongation factor G [Deltaproteobacteria bacterium]|nr:elongation factor G [Deltaproteobacteria bacterium]
MKSYDPAQIRNVGLYGHQGSGKTSVGEAIVFLGKATNRLASVVEGNSNFDFEPEEVRRKTSMSTAVGYAEWGRNLVNVIDAPGDSNFAAEAVMSLVAADLGVIVVSAVDGVQVGTGKAADMLAEAGLPRAVFVTKIDKERSDFHKVLADLQAALGPAVVPLALPIGAESSFSGVVDLLALEARTYAGGPNGVKGQPPADMADRIKAAREPLVEKLAEQDDELMMKYLDGGELSADDLKVCLGKGLKSGGVIPVLVGNATGGTGVDLLLDVLATYGPSPLERTSFKTRKGDVAAELKADPSGSFVGYVFKTIVDLQTGKITVFRVVSGSVPAEGFVNVSTAAKERFGGLVKLLGKKTEAVPAGVCGDILAVVKLKETRSGNTLAADAASGELVTTPLPAHCISYAVKPKSQGDEDKVSAAVQRLVDEDVGLGLSRDEESKEFLLHGLGQSHIQTAVDKLKRKFGVDVEMKLPRIAYRETIRGSAKMVEGKHKKQTGGRGQFGVCYIDMEPQPRGTGFVFEDAIFGGAIPRQFIPAIEKGMRDATTRGVVAGYPVVDLKIRLVDGKYHDVDSDARSFEMAGSRGFKAAFKLCKPIILEPIMNLTILIPDESLGDIMGDVSSRRGRIMGTDAAGRMTVVKAQAPLSEVQTYASDLRSMTSDRGSFSMETSHYEELPPQLAEKLVSEAKLEEEEE